MEGKAEKLTWHKAWTAVSSGFSISYTSSRPGILFERCTGWLLSHKVLLPGYSLLERYIARLRNRVENRLWHSLAACIDDSQTQQLLDLLSVSCRKPLFVT
ncbi:DUF4158 domain-containing protein (plasmid) [Escherichia coli]|nr:DUF4158 domain-containing protein [Escherichia coli]